MTFLLPPFDRDKREAGRSPAVTNFRIVESRHSRVAKSRHGPKTNWSLTMMVVFGFGFWRNVVRSIWKNWDVTFLRLPTIYFRRSRFVNRSNFRWEIGFNRTMGWIEVERFHRPTCGLLKCCTVWIVRKQFIDYDIAVRLPRGGKLVFVFYKIW